MGAPEAGQRRRIPECKKRIGAVALLSAAAMTAKKADSYSPETYVIDLADLWQIYYAGGEAEHCIGKSAELLFSSSPRS